MIFSFENLSKFFSDRSIGEAFLKCARKNARFISLTCQEYQDLRMDLLALQYPTEKNYWIGYFQNVDLQTPRRSDSNQLIVDG